MTMKEEIKMLNLVAEECYNKQLVELTTTELSSVVATVAIIKQYG